MRYEWDPYKARINEANHGVLLEDAKRVFADPYHRSVQDRHEGSEERWQTIGMVDGIVLLFVAHTWSDDGEGNETIRLISARRVTKQERRAYEQQGD